MVETASAVIYKRAQGAHIIVICALVGTGKGIYSKASIVIILSAYIAGNQLEAQVFTRVPARFAVHCCVVITIAVFEIGICST